MNKILQLKNCRTRIDLAILLKCKPSFLTFLLYKTKQEDHYEEFEIPKKTGGIRKICSPKGDLKLLQKRLSLLLLDCIDDINSKNKIKNTLSHGFEREKSIITNAEMHRGKKNVLNIDLNNFFDEFNFGRVRGFFISNKDFQLTPEVATTIAQIACYKNKLPQGGPASPVITNLITHILDVILSRLAKKNSCIYTRYADDITFSTRKKLFPSGIMEETDANIYIPSKSLNHEIKRAGFSINSKKTRIQYKDSRQDVTGLTVNKKVGVKREYRQLTKSMCNSLFHTGEYTKKVNNEDVAGTLKELEGRINFIDSIDFYNRKKHPKKLSIHYQQKNHGLNTRLLLSGREKLLSKFLFYKNFIGNDKVTILCEGKTDNIYIKSALKTLVNNYPKLAEKKAEEPYKSYLNILNYSKRTKFFLELAGGTPYLNFFIKNYEKHYNFYKSVPAEKPVIIILDNDDGFKLIINTIKEIKNHTCLPYPNRRQTPIEYLKNADLIHVTHNLYIILTPLSNGNDTMIENLFPPDLWNQDIQGRTFDPTEKLKPEENYYGKKTFATEVIAPNRDHINFDGFRPLFDRLTNVIEHYEKI
ncbi:retron Ec67 family RNA-directed DNA polymerase/endonuclease [Photobacterium carnosum]|uniref:retron Ec67 family RNA-directed DNA polymerase/endonuclease n=1 Tax=Photobacterium carnosum TaxID=2023717 RepID=UPI001E416288|nr:retron Ec67 family RNA-directed DNA polymerase/endonuclease [Photobacterium carnosum]MCD9496609.1 ribonuclease H [Photobacterium carnosum]